MEPLVRILNDGPTHSAKLAFGRAKVPLARHIRDETQPSRWVIIVPRGSFWEPLEWVVNLAINRSREDLIPGITEGVSAGSGVYLDPVGSVGERQDLARRWTEETGLEPGPHPMILGTVFVIDELLVPLAYLQAIYHVLQTQMAPCRPAPPEGAD